MNGDKSTVYFWNIMRCISRGHGYVCFYMPTDILYITDFMIGAASLFQVSLGIGFLFLGGGMRTFSTSNSSIAALLITLYPRLPTGPNDNRCHLLVNFVHFWWILAFWKTEKEPIWDGAFFDEFEENMYGVVYFLERR